MPLGYLILSKVVPCPLPSCFLLFWWALSGPTMLPLHLLEGQPENSWPLGGKYCIISNPSRYSGLPLPWFLQHATKASLSESARAGDRHTMPARSPSVSGIPSRAIQLPGIMFATLEVSPAGYLGPDPYHPSPKVTNIPTPGLNLHSTFMEHLVCCLISICS